MSPHQAKTWSNATASASAIRRRSCWWAREIRKRANCGRSFWTAFGLSVEVKTPEDLPTRIEVVKRRDAFESDPSGFVAQWAKQEAMSRKRILAARERINQVKVPEQALTKAAELCMALGTDGLRGELTLVRAARALAAIEGDKSVDDVHLRRVAPSSLRHRLRRNPLDDSGSTARVERALCGVLSRMSGAAVWPQAVTAAALFAVDPAGTGGICVRAAAGPVRDRWLEVLRRFLPPSAGLRKLSPGISDGRLLGGIDLAATLQAGRPVVERGLLAEIDGGVLLAPMAERLSLSTAAHICAALDSREIVVERDGLSLRLASSFGVVAFDEGIDDESGPASLRDRLAFQLDLDGLSHAQATEAFYDPDDIAAARDRLRHVTVPADAVAALCSVAASLGIASLRAPLLAVRVARAAAALDGLDAVARAHVEVAARLVLAPRATIMPAPPEDVPEPPQQHEPSEAERDAAEDKPLDDLVLEAAQAAIPPDLLKRLQDTMAGRQRNASAGKQGQSRMGPRRGRPVGVRRGDLRAGARLNVLETLRAAAPWQPLRRRAGGLGNKRQACPDPQG